MTVPSNHHKSQSLSPPEEAQILLLPTNPADQQEETTYQHIKLSMEPTRTHEHQVICIASQHAYAQRARGLGVEHLPLTRTPRRPERKRPPWPRRTRPLRWRRSSWCRRCPHRLPTARRRVTCRASPQGVPAGSATATWPSFSSCRQPWVKAPARRLRERGPPLARQRPVRAPARERARHRRARAGAARCPPCG
uniref:Uncharacterized protein n=1 Tax=Arundo donax TaxID=35708 RepID=A0A0A9DCX0_ARUDO